MFSVNRQALLRELSLLQSVTERKGTIPVLAMALFAFDGETLHLTATDCSRTLRTQAGANGEPYSGCLPLYQLASLLKLLDAEDVAFSPQVNGFVTVSAGRSKHKLPGLEASVFPDAHSLTNATGRFTVNAEQLRDALGRTLPCVSTEESRWTLQGVQFELKDGQLRLIATDSHRLAVCAVPVEGDDLAVLVPADGLASLLKMDAETITVDVSSNHVQFTCGTRTLLVRLLTGTFPNWQMIMPATLAHTVEVDTVQLITAIRRVSVTREERFKNGVGMMLGAIRLDFSRETLTVSTEETDAGQSTEVIAASTNLNGDDVAAGFNPDYLMDFLARAGDRVVMQLNDGKTQLLMTTPGVDCRYVVMPVRL